MTVRTYDPQSLIAIFGAVPIVEWNTIRIIKPAFRRLVKGKDNELCRGRLKDNNLVIVELKLSSSSHLNLALTMLKELDLPIPIHIVEANNFLGGSGASSIAANTALSITAANFLTSQAFIWPATFIDSDGSSWSKVSGEVTWTFQGILIGEIIGGNID